MTKSLDGAGYTETEAEHESALEESKYTRGGNIPLHKLSKMIQMWGMKHYSNSHLKRAHDMSYAEIASTVVKTDGTRATARAGKKAMRRVRKWGTNVRKYFTQWFCKPPKSPGRPKIGKQDFPLPWQLCILRENTMPSLLVTILKLFQKLVSTQITYRNCSGNGMSTLSSRQIAKMKELWNTGLGFRSRAADWTALP